jgi:hypothetical protein
VVGGSAEGGESRTVEQWRDDGRRTTEDRGRVTEKEQKGTKGTKRYISKTMAREKYHGEFAVLNFRESK